VKKFLGPAVLGACLLLTACNSGMQTLHVNMASCTVAPMHAKAGPVVFEVKNPSGMAKRFAVTENDGEGVASEVVASGDTVQVPVHLDGDDVYHVACGGVMGDDIHPDE